ncbi:pyridoxamine 5'-phosphate oxidase family protein [Halonotius terrestris]|uniref:Pyridoxamine 5'-phosphate oxidase family protein n=1 Tax=Halonotius terrestris TaxID=2487750 RepID=A0A8J8P9E0_9EURY|nr:pyridoxamine 5'-phosphate oxidase family protein [Halonotius terrestris]TQQ81045.1 pyridoxamine 5'-phosphate oxidase family protein [Halonotius terrestris]
MDRLSGAWDAAETEAFLDSATVPLRLSCHANGESLWMLSLWFLYQDEAFWCATSANADVVDYLADNDRVAFEVSTNEPPYKGVRGNGTATVEPDSEKALLRELLERYLGGTDSDLADRLLSPERDEVTIQIDPNRLYTWDFTDRMADVTPE